MNRHLVFACIIFFVSLSSAQSVRWSEGEHLELGMAASALACRSLEIPLRQCPTQNISRNNGKDHFQYGEVLTAGDYYNTPKEFLTDKKPMLGLVLKCAYKQKNLHSSQQFSDVHYPECNSVGLAGLRDYLYVISHNYNHFGWNNMVSYVDLHQQALDFAVQAFHTAKSDPGKSRALLNTAITYNAFADHFLTDAFASGHIRVPRLQIKEWARENLRGPLRASRGDLLTMYLHDFESRNLRTRKEEGLRVQNSWGDVWQTRGDGSLFLLVDPKDLSIALPRAAVAESLREVLLAWQTGVVPAGIFSATHYVPFSYDKSLLEKLSPNYQQVRRNRDIAHLIFYSLPMMDKFLFRTGDFTKCWINFLEFSFASDRMWSRTKTIEKNFTSACHQNISKPT